MKFRFLARSGAVLTVTAIGLSGGEGASVRDARADDARPAAAAGSQCVLKGTHPVAKGTQLFDAASGGRAIASFTGAFVPLQLSDLPADPTVGRARLSTSTGSGSFRIDGFVSPSSIHVFTAKDVPIAAGHVWISSAQKVKLVRAAPGALTAELAVAGSQQAVRGAAGCDAFTLTRGTPTAMDTPGNGRGWLTKGTSIELFDDAGGTAIFTLKMMEGTSQLFWSTESKSGFIHIKSRADITVDAWARTRDLEALKRGEMMDQFIPSTTTVAGAQLSFDTPPKLVTATKEIPIRLKREDKDKPIGAIEIGAEVYLIETINGWTNVLPKALGLTPPDESGFWIPSADAPK